MNAFFLLPLLVTVYAGFPWSIPLPFPEPIPKADLYSDTIPVAVLLRDLDRDALLFAVVIHARLAVSSADVRATKLYTGDDLFLVPIETLAQELAIRYGSLILRLRAHVNGVDMLLHPWLGIRSIEMERRERFRAAAKLALVRGEAVNPSTGCDNPGATEDALFTDRDVVRPIVDWYFVNC